MNKVIETNQTGKFNPGWMNPTPKKNPIKLIGFGILSLIKALAQSILFIAWLIVGLILASTYYEPFTGIRSSIISSWGILFIFLVIYEFIKNFKEIK